MSELKEILDDVHERANAAAEVLFHLGAEAAIAIVLSALMDRERFDTWLHTRPDLRRDPQPTKPHNEVYIAYLQHVIEEEMLDGD